MAWRSPAKELLVRNCVPIYRILAILGDPGQDFVQGGKIAPRERALGEQTKAYSKLE
jgi:hypothetical protein